MRPKNETYTEINNSVEESVTGDALLGGEENLAVGEEGTVQPRSWCANAAPLLSMAACAFAIGITEFVTTGLLPEVSESFKIPITTAAFVTSGYALAVGAGPLITGATLRWNRKFVLSALMMLFTLGSLVSALSPIFAVLMIGRVLSALCHGSFFGIGSVVVTSLAPEGKGGTAVALMFTGLTLAHILGLPLGTLMGQHYGWRSPFWVITGLGVLGFLSLVVTLPWKLPIPKTTLLTELKMFTRPQVWLALFMTAMGFGGLLAFFGYVAPIMTHVSGFSKSSLTWLIGIYGLGLVVGINLGGKMADRALMPTIYGLLSILATLLATFTYVAHYKIPAAIMLFFLGAAGFATIPPLQKYVMSKADAAPTLVSSTNIGAFNLGTALAVYFGGVSINLGYGYSSASMVGAVMTTIGLMVAVVGNFKCSQRFLEGLGKFCFRGGCLSLFSRTKEENDGETIDVYEEAAHLEDETNNQGMTGNSNIV